ncbi:unnamed protein product [Clavelina lepadiformis]|uniref:EGF-like domain-containing protein n=1 Tax=Clavelina lepadiformis TaxID=159417 RepID=A0ABP0FU12_CLALP
MDLKKTAILVLSTAIVFSLLRLAEAKSTSRRHNRSNGRGTPCDENGNCKYGGRCGDDNTCSCNFKCKQSFWPVEFYCDPVQPGKVYYNLCQVLARACELQRDVPIVRADMKKPRNKRCNSEKKPEYEFCPNAQDFMGRCGATLSQYGSSEAGVCLQRVGTKDTFCQCPSHKTGAECQQKILSVRSVGPEVDEGKDGNKGSETDFIIRVAVFSLACTLSVIIMAVFVWKRLKMSKTCDGFDDVKPSSTLSEHQYCIEMTSRDDASLKSVKSRDEELSECGSDTSARLESVVVLNLTRGQRSRLSAQSLPTVASVSCDVAPTASLQDKTESISNNNNLQV